jgi:L-ascorbate metabolism protein UlaG (beta-lactamase superfamily)
MVVMIITYFGKQFFKITQGDMAIAFNPVSKNSKTGISAKFGADIGLITTNHPDYNGVDQISHGDRVPFIISGPGDYEVKEIFVKGVMTNAQISGKKYINSIYCLTVDGIDITFLGSLSDINIGKDAIEAIEEPDILFIPVGGKGAKENGGLDVKDAAKLASSLEPKMIIPMDYDEASLKAFLKEIGEEKVEVVDKLTLKRKDLEGKESEVVVLKAI